MKRFYIENKSINGINNPLLYISIYSKDKIDKIEVIENGDVIDSKIKKTGFNLYEIKSCLLNKSDISVKIIINGELKLICSMKNRKFKRIVNKIHFILFNNKLGRGLLKLKRAVKFLWKEHHFLVPFGLWPYYSKILFETLFNRYYNPFRQREYIKWYKRNMKEDENVNVDFKYNPLISILIPTYNIERGYLSECLDSILNQSYTNFEICIADDCSTKEETINTLKEYEKKDKRIKVVYRKENGHISNATNSAYALAKGEFIGLMDNDDLITKNALYEMVKALNEDKTIDMIYSDEDKLDMKGQVCDPHFKPDWSPNSFLGGNYLCHFVIMRKSILDKIGGERTEFNGAQDFDYFLRFVEKAKNIKHVSRILYHWRKIPGSTADTVDNKDYAIENGRHAVEEALKRRKLDGVVELPVHSTQYVVKYRHSSPFLSVIINVDNYQTVEKCIESIELNNYKNIEIILIDKKGKLSSLNKENIKVINSNDFFNIAKGEVYLFINSSNILLGKDDIYDMVGYAIQKNIGAVGTKMVYLNGKIENAGLILGKNCKLMRAFKNFDKESVGFYGRLLVPYDYSIVPIDCMMIEAKKYKKIKNNSANLDFYGNNVYMCLSLLDKNLSNVILPFIEVLTYEKYSKERFIDKESKKYLKSKFNLNDIFYNENFSKQAPFYLDRKKDKKS